MHIQKITNQALEAQYLHASFLIHNDQLSTACQKKKESRYDMDSIKEMFTYKHSLIN